MSYTNWRNPIIKCGFLPNMLPITKLLPWNLTYSHVVLFGHTGTSGQYPHVFSPHLMITLVPTFILSHVSSVHWPISQISYAFEKKTEILSLVFFYMDTGHLQILNIMRAQSLKFCGLPCNHVYRVNPSPCQAFQSPSGRIPLVYITLA